MSTVPRVVVLAVQQKIRDLNQQLSFLAEDKQIKREAADKAEKSFVETRAQLDEAKAFLAGLAVDAADLPVADEPESGVDTEPDKVAPPAGSLLQINARQAVEEAAKLLGDGRWWKMLAIYDAIKASGKTLVADEPIRRLTQAMSASKLFLADRSLGWRLKAGKAIDPGEIA